VWWSWTAPVTGAAIISTEGSSFDTLLAIYSGTAFSNLTQVATNDDAAFGIPTSLVSFPTTAGEVFQIAVDGFDGESGDVSLRIDNGSFSLSAPHRLGDGTFQFTLSGLAGIYEIDATADFAGWTTVATLTNANGAPVFADPPNANLNPRFYRARLKP